MAATAAANAANTETERMRYSERFFKDYFSKPIIGDDRLSKFIVDSFCVGKGSKCFKPIAYAFILVAFSYGGFMIYQASMLTPPTAQVDLCLFLRIALWSFLPSHSCAQNFGYFYLSTVVCVCVCTCLCVRVLVCACVS